MNRRRYTHRVSALRALRWPLFRLIVVVGVLSTTVVSVAEAQERRRSRTVIRLTETTIEGRIQKPQAFYILQRSNLNFKGLALKKSFVPKVIKSVKKAPF